LKKKGATMKFSKLLISLETALLLAACESTVSSDSSEYEISSSDLTKNGIFLATYPSDQVQNEYEGELYINFAWLDLAYIYGHTRNEIGDNYKVYLGKGTADVNKVKGYCTADYYDVCYMYNQMADPFTQYFDPNVADQVYKSVMETNEIVGIGADVEPVSDGTSSYLTITKIYPESPAKKAGLIEGDIIVSIDGLSISTSENFEKMCSGEKGSTIQITVLRNGGTIVANVTLDEYHAPSVIIHYEDSIPVIEILEFSETTIHPKGTYGEFLEALEKTAGATSTIIDLRQNPGGSVDHCNNISMEFLSAGDTVIMDQMVNIDTTTVNGKLKLIQRIDTIVTTATKDGIGKDRYYVLMSSDSSASCAEVVLSAVSVNKRSPIVGVTSYGKGIGQGVFTEKEHGIRGLALITAMQGFDKNGESYHDVGIVPDYEILDPDEQMAKAVELAKGATELRTAGYGTERLYHFSKARESINSNKKIPDIRDLKTRYKIMH
jgi:C-terminal peptidase prc